jgi:hypothetical protein
MKKKSAVFTIVKNEYYFLPIWLKYYKQYFNDSDIYVLDHQTNDGSTNNLSVNVVPIVNELAFDHQWLVDTVQNFQKELLEKYECVIFAESDELLYSPDFKLNDLIDNFLNDNNLTHLSSIGHEIIQDLNNEKSLSINDEILENRNYWFRDDMYDKTLISKIPLKWEWGFHQITNGRRNNSFNVHLCHLHRCDFELMLKRHEERAKKWNLKNDINGAGHQHRIGDREGVLKYFKDVRSSVVEIPQNHKSAIGKI